MLIETVLSTSSVDDVGRELPRDGLSDFSLEEVGYPLVLARILPLSMHDELSV